MGGQVVASRDLRRIRRTCYSLYRKAEVAFLALMVAISEADNPQKRPIQILFQQSRTK